MEFIVFKYCIFNTIQEPSLKWQLFISLHIYPHTVYMCQFIYQLIIWHIGLFFVMNYRGKLSIICFNLSPCCQEERILLLLKLLWNQSNAPAHVAFGYTSGTNPSSVLFNDILRFFFLFFFFSLFGDYNPMMELVFGFPLLLRFLRLGASMILCILSVIIFPYSFLWCCSGGI